MPEHTPAPTPARSLYGFLMYFFSKTILAVYCIWAITPEYYLHYFNIYYYPQKYWCTAVPVQCLVALTMFAFLVYPSSNLMLTSNIDSIHTICDPQSEHSHCEKYDNYFTFRDSCVCTDENKCMKYSYSATCQEFNENIVPQLFDIDIRIVCRKLYLNRSKTQLKYMLD